MEAEGKAVEEGYGISIHSRKTSALFSGSFVCPDSCLRGRSKKNLRSCDLPYKVFSILCLFAFYLLPTLCHAVDEQVERIQKAYENINDIKGNFIQKNHIRDLKRTDVYKGEFFIKRQRMRWEYKGDKPQSVYISGDEIIIYQHKEKQAFKSKFDKTTYGHAPIALLGGFGNIKEEFDVSVNSSVNGQQSAVKLILKPKKPITNISHIELVPSDREFPIEYLVIVDSLSNRIEIYLKDVTLNTGIKDKTFEFTPPKDVNVLRQ